MRTFAKNLKEERMLIGMTQQQMADALGIPLKTYQGYEAQGLANRKPDYDMLVKIADILNVTTDELLGRK